MNLSLQEGPAQRIRELLGRAPKPFGRRRSVLRAHVFWRFAYPVLVLAAGVAVLLLILAGGRAVLTQRVTSVEQPVVLAPDEPGYLELVSATPTLLALHTDDAELAGVSFVARTGIEAGGGVVLLPADLLVVPPQGSPPQGRLLSEVFARDGAAGVEQAAEEIFGVGFDEVVEVPADWLAYSIAPATPLPYLLADDLVEAPADGEFRVVYEAGRNELTASDAAAIYSHLNPDEPDGNRTYRQKALWESWLGMIGRASDPQAVIPPLDSPLAPHLRALASGTTVVVDVPPFEISSVDSASAPVAVLDDRGRDWLRNEVLELVPWPRQPESFLRPRVQLLDGTGDPAIRDALAGDVVAAGGVVTAIGNSDAFGVRDTQFAYHRAELVRDPVTNSIALQLGVNMTLVEAGEPADNLVDITVTVGLDQANR
ncbi:MAG: hypothetical protein OXE79_09950 [Acidimicrobiaceae bacterium]|nr:hypothetical protein [Acidimicrobiaceae bacterium]MCY4175196.1 hypothetical protein [Acidimicrobiaceae bacterium]